MDICLVASASTTYTHTAMHVAKITWAVKHFASTTAATAQVTAKMALPKPIFTRDWLMNLKYKSSCTPVETRNAIEAPLLLYKGMNAALAAIFNTDTVMVI